MTCILAIDTATDRCMVALSENRASFIEEYHSGIREHTQYLLPLIHRVFENMQRSIADVDAIALGAGPGSFTGIRLAASVVQGLSFGLQKPVILLSTLQIIAEGVYRKEGIFQVNVSLPSRLNELYMGQYRRDAAQACMVACGDPMRVSRASLLTDPTEYPWREALPEAQDMLYLAHQTYESGQMVSAEDALPQYFQSPHLGG
jgi:tRNA threonylcarbamoyladenosine biosynthesis protein TsaB